MGMNTSKYGFICACLLQWERCCASCVLLIYSLYFRVDTVGLTLADKKEGSFSLEIAEISAVRTKDLPKDKKFLFV